MTRLRHLLLGLSVLPTLLLDPRWRQLLAEMRAFLRVLPDTLATPLPDALASIRLLPDRHPLLLEGLDGKGTGGEEIIRRLADLAALLDRQSPLGLCLRRSLVRYHFLGRAGVPLVIHFGARLNHGRPDREVTGHAWVSLNGKPYYEEGENYSGYTVMIQYP